MQPPRTAKAPQAAPMNRILWLASFPKSGNTWMRMLLAHLFMPEGEAPDINSIRRFTTADVRQDFFDKAAGRPFVAEGFDDWLAMRQKALRLIAASKPGHHFVKTHSQIGSFGTRHLIPPEVTAAGVYLLRNPLDVALSYARHLGEPVDATIDRMSDENAVNATPSKLLELIGRWDAHVEGWTGCGMRLHLLRYEDLLGDTEAAVRGLLGFLGTKVPDGRIRKAIRATRFEKLAKQEAEAGFIERPPAMERFFARGEAGQWREDLTPAQIGRIADAFGPAIARWYPELVPEIERARA